MGKEGTSRTWVTADVRTTPKDDGGGHHRRWASSYDPLDPSSPALPSIGEIRSVVPSRCFRRSYVRSAHYLVRDTAMAVGCVAVARRCLSADLPTGNNLLGGMPDGGALLVWFAGWSAYSFCMGCVITGHWVLAHECGHGAFSPSRTLNDVCGFVMHQALLVPYFSWQRELCVFV
jgi:hypothetical protein